MTIKELNKSVNVGDIFERLGDSYVIKEKVETDTEIIFTLDLNGTGFYLDKVKIKK